MAPASLETELVRMEQCHRLRARLAALCRMCHAPRPPILIFERWQCRVKLFEESGDCRDVLLPTRLDRVFVKDVMRLGLYEKDACWVRDEFAKDLQEALGAINEKYAVCEKEPVVTVNERGSIVYCAVKHKTLKVNKTHSDRLRKAYTENAPSDTASFDVRLFALLCRYSALHGHGYQAAVDEKTFALLEERLGVSMEMFASPLNSYFSNFCSAFYDTDHYFGSQGSFFDFTPPANGGSFQANPPFVPETMLSMVDHMHHLLDVTERTSNAPLSFIVFVPHWNEVKAVRALKESPFLAISTIVTANAHGYVNGAAHQSESRYRFSSFDTFVVLLQNAEGKRKWPATERLMRKIAKQMGKVDTSQGGTNECQFAVEPRYCTTTTKDGSRKRIRDEVPVNQPAGGNAETEVQAVAGLEIKKRKRSSSVCETAEEIPTKKQKQKKKQKTEADSERA